MTTESQGCSGAGRSGGMGEVALILRGLAAVRDPTKPIPLVDREAPHDPAGPLDLDPTRPVYPLEGGEDARIQRPRSLLDVDRVPAQVRARSCPEVVLIQAPPQAQIIRRRMARDVEGQLARDLILIRQEQRPLGPRHAG